MAIAVAVRTRPLHPRRRGCLPAAWRSASSVFSSTSHRGQGRLDVLAASSARPVVSIISAMARHPCLCHAEPGSHWAKCCDRRCQAGASSCRRACWPDCPRSGASVPQAGSKLRLSAGLIAASDSRSLSGQQIAALRWISASRTAISRLTDRAQHFIGVLRPCCAPERAAIETVPGCQADHRQDRDQAAKHQKIGLRNKLLGHVGRGSPRNAEPPATAERGGSISIAIKR